MGSSQAASLLTTCGTARPFRLCAAGPMTDLGTGEGEGRSGDHQRISYRFVIVALRVRRGSVKVRRMIITSDLSAASGRGDCQAVNGVEDRRAWARHRAAPVACLRCIHPLETSPERTLADDQIGDYSLASMWQLGLLR